MSEPEWDVEERDHISKLTRNEMLVEICMDMAGMDIDDHDHQTHYEYHLAGVNAAIWKSTHSLRTEMYENAGVPEGPERHYPEGEIEPTGMTLGSFLTKLAYLAIDPRIKDPSQWRVVMRHKVNDDMTLGAQIGEIKLDGFYQHVNLVGPIETDPKTGRHRWELFKEDENRCPSKDIIPVMDRYKVRQCHHGIGHTQRHRYRVRDDQPIDGFATMREAKEWLRQN